MARLGLRHDEGAVLLRDLAQGLRLLAGDVDGAFAGEGRVIEIEHLVVEGLERAFREGDEAYGEIEARQPRRGLHQVREMLEVDLDVLALADPADGGDEADGGVGLDHVWLLVVRTRSTVRSAADRPARTGGNRTDWPWPRPRPPGGRRRRSCSRGESGVGGHRG